MIGIIGAVGWDSLSLNRLLEKRIFSKKGTNDLPPDKLEIFKNKKNKPTGFYFQKQHIQGDITRFKKENEL